LTEPTDGKQAFHVVAPSLPGYGFSEYSKKSGFGLEQHAECFVNLMKKLGYLKFVCQVSLSSSLAPFQNIPLII
jgi:pimeloyl-ACP methyl ester carboxylesterase